MLGLGRCCRCLLLGTTTLLNPSHQLQQPGGVGRLLLPTVLLIAAIAKTQTLPTSATATSEAAQDSHTSCDSLLVLGGCFLGGFKVATGARDLGRCVVRPTAKQDNSSQATAAVVVGGMGHPALQVTLTQRQAAPPSDPHRGCQCTQCTSESPKRVQCN